MSKDKKSKQTQQDASMYNEKKSIRILITVWTIVLVLITLAFTITTIVNFTRGETISLVNSIISFSSFIATSLFSFLIYNHNATVRETNRGNESFRTLQFAASNLSITEFVDNMLIHEEYPNYLKKLKISKNFMFYLMESGMDITDLTERDNFDSYFFLTARIPFILREGKSISKIKISRFTFAKDDKEYRFVPCSKNSNAVLLYNDSLKRNEMVINIVTKKTSSFYVQGELDIFNKIRLNLSMQSLLGVVVKGWTELYFTNPTRLEKDGATKYKINSSYFEIQGAPQLLTSVEDDIQNV